MSFILTECPLVAEITYCMLHKYDFWVLSKTITIGVVFQRTWQLVMEGPTKDTN